jgi:hypothetical protein
MAVGAGLFNRGGSGHSSDRRHDGAGMVDKSRHSEVPDLTDCSGTNPLVSAISQSHCAFSGAWDPKNSCRPGIQDSPTNGEYD